MTVRPWRAAAAAVVVALARAAAAAPSGAPDGLTVEFCQGAEVVDVADATPEFGWIVQSSRPDDAQTAYRVLVSTDRKTLDRDQADAWDSGKVASADSVNVTYAGAPLRGRETYYWKVKTWRRRAGESPWSNIQAFTTVALDGGYLTTRYPLRKTPVAPVRVDRKAEGHYLVDFGKVAFGYLHLTLNAPTNGHTVIVHLAERGSPEGANRKPGGTVRYYRVPVMLSQGRNELEVRPPRDSRNTEGAAIRLPEAIGVIAPFRYVEIENSPSALDANAIRQIAVHYEFDETASRFESSDPVLDAIWALCKYSMKATSFCGVYVDGDRERIPYEADAYINQLSHYAVDREYTLARSSHEYLLKHPTWPTEWLQHSVLMAWADYMYTGNTESLAPHYELMKSSKTLEKRAREDGLLNTRGLRDIVDWPVGERDGYEFKEVNTVVNAFYYRTLRQMADLAAALGKEEEAAAYREKAATVKTAFHKVFFDPVRGVYVDGEGARHAALHANMMPLAFGLVPEEHKKSVTDFVVSRGMACSVYGAQYLLEALYEGGRPEVALESMTSKDLRSWYNMLRVGSTITLEAWDDQFKPNQDWNHAWGAVPGNIIPRYLLGVRPLEPGFAKALIQPQPASLRTASATIPTIRGPIAVSFENEPERPFVLRVEIPVNMTARVGLPQRGTGSATLKVNGRKTPAQVSNGYLFVDGIGSGSHTFVSP